MSHDRNTHGMGAELVAATWPALTAREMATVLDQYSLDCSEISIEWTSPRPFSAAALVRSGTQIRFIKRHHRSVRTPAQLTEEHVFISHLGARGINVATVLRDRDGQSSLAIGDWTYEVHTPARGADLYRDAPSWTPFSRLEHAASAGRLLGRMHRAASGFTAPARQTGQLVTRFDALKSADPMSRLEQLLRAHPLLAAALEQRPWREDVARLVLPWHDRLTRYLDELPPLWTHNDWHASNLLWTDEQASVVIDFGLANRTTAIFDLATALERNTIEWLERGNPPVHLDHAAALIEGYLTEASLTAAELAALPVLLPIVHVEFALSELEYFHGITESAADADLAYHGYLLGHIRWFNSPAGQHYLTRLCNLFRL